MTSVATQLGRTAHVVSRLAFGCEQLGGYQWGKVDPLEIAAAIELAIAEGVTLFDTADCYGRGESERRLGRALAPHRERVILATKFGVRFSGSGSVFYDSSPTWAERALDESLKRLGTEVVDLLQMHYWDGLTPLEELFDHLERLRARHKIRWYGISNCVPQGLKLEAYPGLVSASLEYSLVDRSEERAAQQLRAGGLTFLAYGCLGQGLLSGKYGPNDRFGTDDRRSDARYRNFHGQRLIRNYRIIEVLKAQAVGLGVTASQLAIAWVLHGLPECIALVGIKHRAQLNDALSALRLQLPRDIFAALDAVSAESPIDNHMAAS